MWLLLLLVYVSLDLFLLHQIFSAKVTFEIKRSTALRCTLKRSAITEGVCASGRHSASASGKREVFLWTVGPVHFGCRLLLCWPGFDDGLSFSHSSALCCSGLSLCWTVLPDAVISSVHAPITVCSILCGGSLRDEREGSEGERWRRCRSDLLLHKEDYLFINVSIWTFTIFGCLCRLFVFVWGVLWEFNPDESKMRLDICVISQNLSTKRLSHTVTQLWLDVCWIPFVADTN